MNIKSESGYKANEWNKSKDGKDFLCVYVEDGNGSSDTWAEPRFPKPRQFVPDRNASTEFGIITDATKAKVTITSAGGHTILLGPTGRTDQSGRVLSREEQITMGMCMNNAGRLLPSMHDLSGKTDAEVADLMVNLAQALFDRYV